MALCGVNGRIPPSRGIDQATWRSTRPYTSVEHDDRNPSLSCPADRWRAEAALRRRGGDRLLVPSPLHRGWDAQRVAVLGDRAPRDVDARVAQEFDDGVVGQDVGGAFPIDQLLDAMAHSFSRMCVAAVRRRYR